MTESTQWIPVGERLPDDDRFVLILIDALEFAGVYTSKQNRWEWCDPDGAFHPAHKVTHWQESPPLPILYPLGILIKEQSQ